MNKTDTVFSGIPKNKSQAKQGVDDKRDKQREKSLVLEMKELKKQVDEEIRKEILQGKLDIHSCKNQKSN